VNSNFGQLKEALESMFDEDVPNEQLDEFNAILGNPEYMVHYFQRNAWDLPSFINWCARMIALACEEEAKWDT